MLVSQHGRSQDFSKGGSHLFIQWVLTRLSPEYCSHLQVVSLQKGLQREGGSRAPQDPLATPLPKPNQFCSNKFTWLPATCVKTPYLMTAWIQLGSVKLNLHDCQSSVINSFQQTQKQKQKKRSFCSHPFPHFPHILKVDLIQGRHRPCCQTFPHFQLIPAIRTLFYNKITAVQMIP